MKAENGLYWTLPEHVRVIDGIHWVAAFLGDSCVGETIRYNFGHIDSNGNPVEKDTIGTIVSYERIPAIPRPHIRILLDSDTDGQFHNIGTNAHIWVACRSIGDDLYGPITP